ncbi:hypothetical protein DFQ10_105172 [Winogradskyella eximia]|jgi:Family of unknown function (DUF6452)|uniref:Uncharacterized protein n=1 Tax=Winogradskyella eximia TaxID=262006 RepID=A0A3D9H255_9FLAO|nr:DUF6452 family protein [Winogradskyella eximia]RED43572.1 hypothetical protein DFQ10_105172 [Winogradskyella eximia]|tara:strand:- start:10300 stop:10887 length:588 start_codon:yes stop_codon:yes gene_type:complete
MKNIKFLVLFIAIALINCERDDICPESTQTTPRLIVEFYDATDTEELLNVSRITVYGEGLLEEDDDGNPIEPIVSSDVTLLFNENANSVELPLIIGQEGVLQPPITVRFVLEEETNLRIEDDDPLTNSNKDIIEISYNTEFVYVSRACGYKSNFNSIGVSRVTDDDNWITNIEIEETTQASIENENTTHVRIYHN